MEKRDQIESLLKENSIRSKELSVLKKSGQDVQDEIDINKQEWVDLVDQLKNIEEQETAEKEEKQRTEQLKKRNQTAVKNLQERFRNKEIDLSRLNNCLPKMVWFGKMLRCYGENSEFDPECFENGNQRWTSEETKRLKSFWDEIGYGSVKEWKRIGEDEFKRSIASIEHQLRFLQIDDPSILELVLMYRPESNPNLFKV